MWIETGSPFMDLTEIHIGYNFILITTSLNHGHKKDPFDVIYVKMCSIYLWNGKWKRISFIDVVVNESFLVPIDNACLFHAKIGGYYNK